MSDIFNQADQATTTQEPLVPTSTSQAPVIPPELSEYVGVGKKYATVDEVYKAFPNAQKHISTLEEENRAIKEELAKRKTAEELLNDIQRNITPASNGDPIPPKVDVPDISTLVRKELERAKVQDVYQANQALVVAEFTKVYGDKARDKFTEIARDIGVPIESLNQLALTSPNAVFKLAGLSQAPATKSGHIESDVTAVNKAPDATQYSTRVPLNGGAKEDAAAIAKAREFVLKNL